MMDPTAPLEKFKLAIRQLFTAVQMRQWDMVESATNQLHTVFLETEAAFNPVAEEGQKAEKVEEAEEDEEEKSHASRRRR